MCGHYTYLGSDAVDLVARLSPINHRGPDSEGYWVNKLDTGEATSNPQEAKATGKKLAFGFKRLSIIDVSSHADQPYVLEDGSLAIVFNGEIYNYLELREELRKEGFSFRTNSDTEVLLKAYQCWGTSCFRRFNGMWAVVIFDRANQRIVVSRDRFGIKPLYYRKTARGMEFFSEIKQVLHDLDKVPNQTVIAKYLNRAVLDDGAETFYEGVSRFPASHFAIVSWEAPQTLELHRYWDLEPTVDEKILYDDAVEQFRELFRSSIELRYRSDVPVGACLSGGLDSSSIVSFSGHIGKKIKAFTIDNRDPELSELNYVKDIMNMYPDLTMVSEYNEDDDLNMLDSMLSIQDEPFSGMSVIAQWRVMRLAAKNDVTVLLDGQGGDELLGGYRKYVFFYLKGLLNSGQYILAFKEAARFLSATEFKIFEKEGVRRYLNRTHADVYFDPDLKESVLQNDNGSIGLSGASGFQAKSYDDIYRFSYPQLLRYEDRNSMAFSLESRVPFLDYRLVDMVYHLPSTFLIRNGYTKAILRDAMKDILPASIRGRKSKLGFANAERKWIEKLHRETIIKEFETSETPFLDTKKLAKDLRAESCKVDYKTLVRFYIFDRWHKRFIQNR